ncbi:MAG TPA: wax ester/triacylglycerol synthase family O-acyltransferase, partial [Halieaceae bacterium]|nr:wax ester/triacylglycerol synthase family O-acyltransferase [Halieaceae bacterium]
FGSRQKHAPPKQAELRNVVDAIKHQYDSSMHLVTAMRRFGAAFVGRGGNLAVPWHNVPRTTLNTRVSGARRFVAQSFDFQRVRAVGKAMDATVNDVVLAMCSGALRRYLLTRDELPRHSLKAMAPVSLREETDLDSTNAVGFITADLATNVYDPEKRLRTIQDSMRAGKDLLRSLSSREAALFMQLTQVPALLTSVLGLASRYPAFSTVVSNVPGPRERLYWNGARLDGIYPASIVFDGFAMNITMVSYVDKLDFGIVACRRSLPQVQRMIDHLEDALAELEEVAGTATAPARKRPAPGRGTRRPARQAAGIRPKLAASDKAPAKARAAAKKKATAKKKAPSKKAAPGKAAAKKAAPGKAAAKKAAAKKTAAKTAAKKKAAAKKTTPKKATPKNAAGRRRAGSAQ